MALLPPSDAAGAGLQHRRQAGVGQGLPAVAEVAYRQVQRVKAEALGEQVHQVPQDQVQLGVAHPAHHAARQLVGVDAVGLHPHIGYVGEADLGHLGGGELEGEDRVIGVGPHVAGALQSERGNRAVRTRPQAPFVDDRLARVVERFAPAVTELHRPTGAPGEQSGKQVEGLVPGVVAAELAAHVVRDHPHSRQGDLQHLAEVHAGLVGLVGVRPDGEGVALPSSEAGPVLQSALVGVVVHRGAGHHHLSLGQRSQGVAPVQEDIRTADFVRREDVARSHFGVNRRGAGPHRLEGVEDEGQHLPIHHDQTQRLLGRGLGLGGDHHPGLVAHPAHVVIQDPAVPEAPPHHPLVGDGVHSVGPPGAGLLEAGHFGVGVGQDVHHPRQGRGPGEVEAPDAGMGMRAAQNPGVEQVGKALPGGHVVGVERPSRRLLQGIDARPVAADEAPGHPRSKGLAHGRGPTSPSAACCTARAMPA